NPCTHRSGLVPRIWHAICCCWTLLVQPIATSGQAQRRYMTCPIPSIQGLPSVCRRGGLDRMRHPYLLREVMYLVQPSRLLLLRCRSLGSVRHREPILARLPTGRRRRPEPVRATRCESAPTSGSLTG